MRACALFLSILVTGAATAEPPAPLALNDLVSIALARNPALAQAGYDIDAARGRAVQAGLCPNPMLMVEGDELGSREGPGGFITAPFVSQQIVTGGKLRVGRAVAERAVDQADLELLRQHFTLLTAVRQGFFEVLAARRRVEVLTELLKVATQSYDTTKKLLNAKQVARLDLLQIRIELNRVAAELDAARREQVAAWRRLVTVMGAPELPEGWLQGSLEERLPLYNFDHVRTVLLEQHPEVRSAQVGIERAQLGLKQARIEPIPNVTLGAGYVRDNKGREDEWRFQVGVPVPLFNRNQGNIQSMEAMLSRATQEVTRVRNELERRLATAFGQYAAAQERAERYRTSILPDSREAYKLALAAFMGGQFEYLRVLQALRAIEDANLEYVRNLADAWRAASEIAGLLLEECWPPRRD